MVACPERCPGGAPNEGVLQRPHNHGLPRGPRTHPPDRARQTERRQTRSAEGGGTGPLKSAAHRLCAGEGGT